MAYGSSALHAHSTPIALRGGYAIKTSSTDQTLTLKSATYIADTPTASVVYTLPVVSKTHAGMSFVIKNDAGAGTHTIHVKNADAGSVHVINGQHQALVFVSDAGAWTFFSAHAVSA